MFIIAGIVAAVIVSVIEKRFLLQKVTVGQCIVTFVKNIFVMNMFSLALWKYVFRYERILLGDGYGILDYAKYFVLTFGIGAIFLLAQNMIHKHLAMHEAEQPQSKRNSAVNVLCVILSFVGFLCVFMTDWAKHEYGDLAADQVFITYFSPTAGSDMVNQLSVLEGPVFLAAFLTMILSLLVFSRSQLVIRKAEKALTVLNKTAYRVVSIVLAVAVLSGGLAYGIHKFQLIALYNAYFAKSTIIDDNFVDPRQANIMFPEKKRNLIHIYLESMENSYMSKDLGGFMETNLIPELTRIAEEGYSFSHLANQFGGPQAAIGTTWSVASMVNMSTGLPMKAPTEPNAYGSEGNFLPGAYTLGEILAEQGYEQTLMFGADADFGGLTYYFKSHGDFKIMDYKFAKDNGLIPPNYKVWWGYEDDKLFRFAKDEITRLSETGKPFHFVMETADTHRPEGYLSKNAPTPYPNQYANVVAYSSAEVDKFVRWIQAQPFYRDTTVVITGDHLSMESNFFQFYEFDEDYRRSQYNVILNPDPSVATRDKDILYNRDYANFDMFPTILSSMGASFEGNRLGIGTDLFSGEKTLFEEYGFEEANHELEKKSIFYNEHILK